MPTFVSKDLKTVEKAYPLKGIELKNFRCIPDTEFTQKTLMKVDCIGLYAPELIEDRALLFTREELTEEFNPIEEILYYAGLESKSLSEEEQELLLSDLEEINESFLIETEGMNGRAIRKYFEEQKKSGNFNPFLERWKLTPENLSVARVRGYNATEYQLQVQPQKIKCQLVFFFTPADLFKIFGKAHQDLILDSQLYQYRSLRFLDKPTRLLYCTNRLIELEIELRDTMYRLPPVDRSLSGQSKAFALKGGNKLNLETREIAEELGLDSPDFIKENMTVLFEVMPEKAKQYNAQDIFLTSELDDTQRKFLSVMRQSFGLEPVEIADTTGKNVSNLITDLVFKHYGIIDDKVKRVFTHGKTSLFGLGKAQNVQKISSNHFGVQPFLTVGGLLFTRMARYPVVRGQLGDLDLKSCYASSMAEMSVYFGEPKCLTFRYKKYKPTLKDALQLIKSEDAPKDGWFIRVSGKLEKAINTLVMSDLRFSGKKELLQEKFNISTNRKSINQFNAEKTSKKSAVSTILLKEVKFGLINWNILQALKLLPEEWLEEYLDLRVDAIVYYPGELIVDSFEEYLELSESLSEEPEKEELNQDKKALVTETQHYKNNVALRFPISEYWSKLRAERNKLKKAKDPVQSVYKLAQNSGYGAFACMYLAINNLVTSNMITAMARTNAWMMTYALNGFSPITDGTCFSWETLPYNQTFHDVLSQHPDYLFNYNPEIQSGLNQSEVGQNWIDSNFKQHLSNFYQIPLNHPLIEIFDYELKDESFLTKEGSQTLDTWIESVSYQPTEKEKAEYLKSQEKATGQKFYVNSTQFNLYINTNAANYVKGLDDSSILIDDSSYEFNSQHGHIKARAYSSKRDKGLLPWFISSVTEGYQTPYIYEENQVIKFGEGNDLAIRYLQELNQEIAHPMGFSTRTVKLMKLISRSQFLFLNESQLRNFETNEKTLADLSKVRVSNYQPLLGERFWKTLKPEEVSPYGVEMRDGVDYFSYSKNHPVGLGFELLSLSRSHNGSIESVRKAIQDKILNGCKDFNGAFQIQRSIKYAEEFKTLLAVAIIKKKNCDDDLKSVLIKSAKEPTILTVKPENIYTLAKLWGLEEDE